MIPLLLFIALGDSQGDSRVFDRLVNRIIDVEQVAHILHAGDIVDSRNEWSSQVSLIRLLENSGYPVITTRGNHDSRDRYDDYFPVLPQEVDVLEDPFKVTVLAVDSNLGAEHIGFVDRIIQSRPDRKYVLLLHHPPETCSEETGVGYGNLWGRTMANVLRPTDLIIAGHLHVSCEYKLDNGTQVLVTARAGKKRYRCLPEEDLPEGAFCEDGENPAFLRIGLSDEGEWMWTLVEVL